MTVLALLVASVTELRVGGDDVEEGRAQWKGTQSDSHPAIIAGDHCVLIERALAAKTLPISIF
jgi:hypothetical protein